MTLTCNDRFTGEIFGNPGEWYICVNADMGIVSGPHDTPTRAAMCVEYIYAGNAMKYDAALQRARHAEAMAVRTRLNVPEPA